MDRPWPSCFDGEGSSWPRLERSCHGFGGFTKPIVMIMMEEIDHFPSAPLQGFRMSQIANPVFSACASSQRFLPATWNLHAPRPRTHPSTQPPTISPPLTHPATDQPTHPHPASSANHLPHPTALPTPAPHPPFRFAPKAKLGKRTITASLLTRGSWLEDSTTRA